MTKTMFEMDKFDETNAPLDYDCPECGVGARKRCRKLVSESWTRAKRERGLPAPRQYQHVKPHRERVTRAWREYLNAH